MEPTSKADDNELQKAINSITSADGGSAEQDAVAAVADEVAAGGTDATPATDVVAPEVPPMEIVGITPEQKAAYGDPDLGVVKVKALTDLRPLLDKVDLSPEQRFKIYKEIILATNDKAAIEPAYAAAINIAIEKDKAEALLFIVESIDKLGIGAL